MVRPNYILVIWLFISKENMLGLINESSRDNQFLTQEGDNINLPVIYKKEKKFDLIYYDSEKFYEAKIRFHKMILRLPTLI